MSPFGVLIVAYSPGVGASALLASVLSASALTASTGAGAGFRVAGAAAAGVRGSGGGEAGPRTVQVVEQRSRPGRLGYAGWSCGAIGDVQPEPNRKVAELSLYGRQKKKFANLAENGTNRLDDIKSGPDLASDKKMFFLKNRVSQVGGACCLRFHFTVLIYYITLHLITSHYTSLHRIASYCTSLHHISTLHQILTAVSWPAHACLPSPPYA